MVMIPELRTAFCGCSVRTGTKVVGWVTLVLGVLEFITFSAVIGILAFVVSTTDDEEIGKDVIKYMHDSEKNDIEEVQAFRSIVILLVGNIDGTESDPGYIGRELKGKLEGILIVVFVIMLVIFLLHLLFTSLLLVGAYKNKSGYVLFYLVISIMGLIGYIPLIFSGASFNILVSTVTSCLVQLYFTWVVYSFYKELRSSTKYPPNSLVMLLPGQTQLDGDVPILAPSAVPNDYYYPQK